MLTLYPRLSQLSILVAGMFVSMAAVAQEGYATNIKNSGSVEYSTARVATKAVEPVVKVKGRTANMIILNWIPFQGEVSHYVLERSSDGRNFYEAGLLFTGERSENEPEYYYTDKFRKPYAGPLYYRLRVVGLDGGELYTPVTVLNPVLNQ